MIAGPAHLKTVLMPSSTRRPSLPNSGPRWSITGMSIARRMRSGTGVGPGICRKWRPAVREEFCGIEGPSERMRATIRYSDAPNDYAIFRLMTKLLEQAIEKIREMPEAEQDLAAEVLLNIAAKKWE